MLTRLVAAADAHTHARPTPARCSPDDGASPGRRRLRAAAAGRPAGCGGDGGSGDGRRRERRGGGGGGPAAAALAPAGQELGAAAAGCFSCHGQVCVCTSVCARGSACVCVCEGVGCRHEHCGVLSEALLQAATTGCVHAHLLARVARGGAAWCRGSWRSGAVVVVWRTDPTSSPLVPHHLPTPAPLQRSPLFCSLGATSRQAHLSVCRPPAGAAVPLHQRLPAGHGCLAGAPHAVRDGNSLQSIRRAAVVARACLAASPAVPCVADARSLEPTSRLPPCPPPPPSLPAAAPRRGWCWCASAPAPCCSSSTAGTLWKGAARVGGMIGAGGMSGVGGLARLGVGGGGTTPWLE